MTTQMQAVPLDKIHWAQRFREDLGDIDSMVESMKEKGVIQPITCTPDFELLAGERRVTAARKAGLLEIPALIREKKDALDAREIELMENLERKDFNWPERVRLVQEIDRLHKEKDPNWSGRKTAKLMDRSQAQTQRDLEMAESLEILPELADLTTQDEAYKVVRKFEAKAIVDELHKRQTDALAQEDGGGLEKGVALALKLAATNYQVGDTFQGLAELPDGGVTGGWSRFHVIECDPPYGIDLTNLKSSKDNAASNIHSYEEIEAEQYPAFLNKLAKELYRVAGNHTHLIFWFGPTWQHEVYLALTAAGWSVDVIPCIWTKRQGQTMQPKTYLGRAYEPFYLCRKGVPAILKEGRLNVFDFPTVSGAKKYHPTERPVPLIQEILDTLAGPRSVVLVPFLGSGATLRAAYNLGMVGVGWDMNPEYKAKFMLSIEEDSRTLNGEESEEGTLDGLEEFEAEDDT